MAGDWIKMRSNLWDDPRVSGLADATGSGEAAIVGGLYWLWATADQHTEDGFLQGLTVKSINRKTGIKGFGEAMISIGWLEESDGGLTIPRFEEHNGTSAKNRAQTAKRVAQCKAKVNDKVTEAALPSALPSDESGNGDSVTSALPSDESGNGDSVTSALPREREEKEVNPPLPPKGGKPAIEFKTFLANCKAVNEKPISDYRPVLDYAETVGLPVEMIELCWNEFYRRHAPGGVSESKRYKDWRQAFRKCVEGNWFKLWWHNPETNSFDLTTSGRTAEKVAA